MRAIIVIGWHVAFTITVVPSVLVFVSYVTPGAVRGESVATLWPAAFVCLVIGGIAMRWLWRAALRMDDGR